MFFARADHDWPSRISLQYAVVCGRLVAPSSWSAGRRGPDPSARPPWTTFVARIRRGVPTTTLRVITTLRPRPSVGPSVTFWVVVSTGIFFFFKHIFFFLNFLAIFSFGFTSSRQFCVRSVRTTATTNFGDGSDLYETRTSLSPIRHRTIISAQVGSRKDSEHVLCFGFCQKYDPCVILRF